MAVPAGNAETVRFVCRELASASMRPVVTSVALFGQFAWRANVASRPARTSCAVTTDVAGRVVSVLRVRNARKETAFRPAAYRTAKVSSVEMMAVKDNAGLAVAGKPARTDCASIMDATDWSADPTDVVVTAGNALVRRSAPKASAFPLPQASLAATSSSVALPRAALSPTPCAGQLVSARPAKMNCRPSRS